MEKRVFKLELSQLADQTTSENYFKVQVFEDGKLFLEGVDGKANDIKEIGDFAIFKILSKLVKNKWSGKIEIINSSQYSQNTNYYRYAVDLARKNNIEFNAIYEEIYKIIDLQKLPDGTLEAIEIMRRYNLAGVKQTKNLKTGNWEVSEIALNSKLSSSEQEKMREIFGDFYHPTIEQIGKKIKADERKKNKYQKLADKIIKIFKIQNGNKRCKV